MAPVVPPTCIAAPIESISVKVLSESIGFNSIPCGYTYCKPSQDSIASDPELSIPVIDFSLLTSNNPDERLKMVQDLGKACEDWGFFMVTNHGIPENLIDRLFNACNEFFAMPEEDKLKFDNPNAKFPVTVSSGSTTCNASNKKVLFWRDFLRFFVHPEFYCPDEPTGFSDILSEYSRRSRDLATNLLQGISLSLGLEEDYIQKTMGWDSSTQIFAANYYPPCPQPELTIGVPPHTDHGFLTVLIQNGVGGYEIQRKGKWFYVNAPPNCIFVNIADQTEILSNGKYKSVWHRAKVNNEKARVSVLITNGPSFDTIVSPAESLLGDAPAAYAAMNYMEYLRQQRALKLNDKPIVEKLKLHAN